MNSKPLWAAVAAAFVVIAYQQVQIGRLKKLGGGTTEAASTSRGESDLEARLDELEGRVQRLGKVALADPRAGGTSSVSAEEIEALKEDVSNAAAGALTSGEGRMRLREAIREENAAFEEERRVERATRMKEARDARLAKFIEEARLSDSQAKTITDASAAEWEKMQTLFEDIRGGAKSWQEARPEMRELRQATDDSVKQTLDAGQYQAWETMRAEWRQDR